MKENTTMAEGQRMTAADVVAKVLAGEHGDFVRDAVALIARELMEAEITAEVGAPHGESCPERVAHRNGSPPYVQTPAQRRRWDYCRANSILFCGENGEPAENTESEDVWMMTRSLYQSDIPTDPPSDDADRQAGED